MEGDLSDGMCRCCASEGSFKDFQVPYQWMGVEEIYGNMLKECFDITLTVSEEINNGGICEVCITQLRNARNFKLQVQRTEEKFKKKLEEGAFKTEAIKTEISRFEDDDSNMSADEFSSQEYEVPIKVEKVEEKPKKRAAKASTSKAKKSKASEGEPSVKRLNQQITIFTGDRADEIFHDIEESSISGVFEKHGIETKNHKGTVPDSGHKEALEYGVTVKLERLSDSDSDDGTEERIKPKSKETKMKLKPLKELSKHYNNIKEILKGSNATPIHGKNDIGFMCCYCIDQYPDPADLKVHTLAKHKDTENASFFKRRDLKKYHVKVDITGLKCNSCDEALDNLDDLIVHLKNDHNRLIYTDIKNHIVPFKFEKDELKCFVCSNVFTKFKMLFEHMHKHCRNFVCGVCDSGFFNRRSLYNHEKIHELGEFKCGRCKKVFNSIEKKNSHVRIVHVHEYMLNKCGYCNKNFRGYRSKALHQKTVHGIGTEPIKCKACEKSFSNKDSLGKHIRRYHLMESLYSCSECDMKFYGNKDLAQHMVKHTKTRRFQCKVCYKRFGRQQTLREHMRIHENDRRFNCEHCGMGFVQKCSWRRHLVVKHGKEI